MANIDLRGVVTREVKYSENSRILTVLSKDMGKVSILAGRSRLNRSGALIATQLFCYSDFEVFKNRDRGMLRLNEAEVIEPFAELRSSLDKMAYASYFCDVANHLCYEGTEQNGILRLLLNSLSKLNKDGGDGAIKIEAVFLLRALREAGFAPDCGGCVCGGGGSIKLLCPTDGVFCCEECAAEKEGEFRIEVNDTIYKAISYIVTSGDAAAFSFSLGENSTRYLAEVAESYMTAQLEKRLKTLDYLKMVRDL